MKLLIGLLVFLIISGCVAENGIGEPETETTPTPSITPPPTETLTPKQEEIEFNISVKEFELNKEIYSSREDFNARVVVESAAAVKDVEVKVTGVLVSSGAAIYRAVFTDLKKGENEFFLYQKTPNCTTGCGGVYPGKYEVKVQVLREKEVLAEQSREIELVE